MKKLAVIVPCYNEEAVIEESYRRTKEVLVKLPNPTEIIYINDGSQDKTRSLLDHIAATLPPIISNIIIVPFVLRYGYGVTLPIPFMMLTVGIGEVISCTVLGLIVYGALKKYKGTLFRTA